MKARQLPSRKAKPMTDTSNVVELGRLIPFTIDGDPYETADLSQSAADLLRLAERDPDKFDLGEIEGKDRPRTKRYDDGDIVAITKNARFVSIRQRRPRRLSGCPRCKRSRTTWPGSACFPQSMPDSSSAA